MIYAVIDTNVLVAAAKSHDQVFYEISLSVEDAYMVTNNKKHFPQKPKVVTPSEILILLTESGIIKE